MHIVILPGGTVPGTGTGRKKKIDHKITVACPTGR